MSQQYPVSHPQKRVLDAELIGDSNDQYSIIQICRYRECDGELLLKAVQEVVEKCMDLNIRFQLADDGASFTQYQGRGDLSRITFFDCMSDDEVEKWLAAYIAPNFAPISRSPLYRFTVLKGKTFLALHITIHHTISDGSGIYYLEEIIYDAYKKLEKGEVVETIPSRYFSYLQIEKEYLNSSDFKLDEQYWLDTVGDTSDYPEQLAFSDSTLGNHVIHFNADLVKQLTVYGESLPFKVTPFKLVLSAIGIYLARRYRADSVPILMAYANRHNIGEAAQTTAMLVSTLLLKLDYDPNMTFEQYLECSSRLMKEGLIHGRYPFDILSDHLTKRGEATNKIFNFSVVSNSVVETEYEVETGVPQNAAFPLVFRSNYGKFDKNGLQTINIEYIKELFTDKDIEFMAKGIEALLNDLVQGTDRPISQLSILGVEEQKIILEDFQGETALYSKKTFVERFRENATQYPDHIAVVDAHKQISYAALDSLSDSVASILESDYGVNGRFAAIMVPRTIDFFSSVLAVMKAGGAYVPIDTSYPQDRIEYMLHDSDASVLITSNQLPQTICDFKGKILYVEDLLNDNGKHPTVKVTPEDLAYMIYTSGSTGKPKGVMIRHKSLSAMLGWKTDKFDLSHTSKTCVHSSFSFDASIIDLFPASYVGGTLHIISDEMRFDLAGFYQYLQQHQIQDCSLPTQLGSELLISYEVPLKNVMLGGEKLKALPRRNVTINNGYGPTEFTVCSSYFPVNQDVNYDNIPIGKPVPNTWNYVVDKNLRLVPRGATGELCLAGVQIAKGYWNREDLTEEVFVKNPYASCEDNHLMYRTGDLVRWNEFGELEYLGRFDDQVKLRGFRIELGEIENAMTAFPNVESAVVLVHNDLLSGYYVSSTDIDELQLVSEMSERLPEYMIPSGFMRLDKMPITPGGKVDKKSLPKLELKKEEIAEPINEMQKEIVAIVCDIIDVESLGIKTDLFHAGMSSLSAIKITAMLSKKYGVSLNARDVIQGKTVLAIEALLLQSSMHDESDYARLDDYPLTQSQLGVYFDCSKNPGTLKYNIPFMLKFSNTIDTQKLVAAWHSTVEAHSYIKTHLKMHGQELRQLRVDELNIDISVEKVSEEKFLEIKKNYISPFNLFEGPLFKGNIYQTEDNTYLLADFHHLIFDGSSVDIFLTDMSLVYSEKNISPEKFTSFDLAMDEKENESSKAFSDAKEYFAKQLQSCEGSSMIPIDLNSANEATGGLQESIITLPHTDLMEYCSRQGVTPNNLFLSAVTYTLSRFTNSETILISTITNGRSDTKHQENLGMMVKTLPLILSVDNKDSCADFVHHTQQTLFENMTHDSYPFTYISQDHDIRPEIMYAYQSGVVNRYTFDSESVSPEVLDLKTPKFKISIHIEEKEDSFEIHTMYNDALYSAPLMKTFTEGIALTVHGLCQDDSREVGQLSLLSEQQQTLIDRFNETKGHREIKLLHQMFEEHVRKTPDKIALVAIDETLTYAQLNTKANKIAHSLLEKNLEVEDLVAFMLPRDSRLIATMLGIVKAGGAYIPVDPDYPAERIEHVLEDSRAKYLISTGEEQRHFDHTPTLDIDELLKNKNGANPNVSLSPDNLCYLIYTSGSTGKPKGVMLKHTGITNYVAPLPHNRHIMALVQRAHTMLSITTVSFDMFLKESFASLMNGITLVFASEDQVNNPGQLAELFLSSQADAFNATPSRMIQYLESPLFQKAIEQCNVIMAGGEKYPSILFDKLSHLTKATLINTYGPTEITVSSNGKVLTDNHISVGGPLANVQAYVMDSCGNSLPIGVIGELWIGGDGVSRGYWANPEMTKERFPELNGVRFYKTGDLAKWNKHGDIEILGRTDTQIKLRGLRIELDEIETLIYKYPSIETAVVAIKQIHGTEHLCAYYTAGIEVNREELRDYLKKYLTKYMVPTAYMQLDALPVTPNGKTDVKSLPTPDIMANKDYVEPETKTQRIFCNIYEKCLGISKVGIDDNFFDLGGTSLLVAKLTIGAMNEGMNISYGDAFAYPSPREMADHIDHRENVEIEEGEEQYNYEQIHSLLKKNTLESFINGDKQEVGNVLLMGATGFLGIHILKEYIEHYSGSIYCFVRKAERYSAQERLKTLLFYYYENTYEELFNSKIFVIEGDITNPESFRKCFDYPIDTVVNCAANVKHFAAGDSIERINVGGVRNCIDFCLKKRCRLIQVSTTSVAGASIDNQPPIQTNFNETTFYVGQNLDNKYVNSKFKAERLVLEAIGKGLQGKIMRVGNLMGRDLDGEFQINFNTNSFIKRLKAYKAIGTISYTRMGDTTEFAPIDSTARAILALSESPRECVLFHPYNHHYIYIADIIEVMNSRGMNIEGVEDGIFQENFSTAMRDKKKAEQLSGLVAYLNMGNGKKVSMIKTTNDYTIQALYRLGFKWPVTSDQYLDKFIQALSGLNFFDGDQ